MNSNSRFQELEQRFSDLEAELAQSPEKEAFSILHAMIQESRRMAVGPGPASDSEHGLTLETIQNLHKSAPPMEGKAESDGLPEGIRAPDFTLPDIQGRPVSLSDFQGKNIVLVFYPLDWSPACSDQLSLYQSELNEFSKYDTQMIGVSVDSLYSHGAWAAVRGISLPLLADFHPRGEVARRYNVYRETDGFSERALFVIDSAGVIRYCHVAPELSHIPDIYELFDQLKMLHTEAGVSGK